MNVSVAMESVEEEAKKQGDGSVGQSVRVPPLERFASWGAKA